MQWDSLGAGHEVWAHGLRARRGRGAWTREEGTTTVGRRAGFEASMSSAWMGGVELMRAVAGLDADKGQRRRFGGSAGEMAWWLKRESVRLWSDGLVKAWLKWWWGFGERKGTWLRVWRILICLSWDGREGCKHMVR
ncbi:hypothetical protein M0R45_015797 [Rubus argutus]|uniref:Uncharacterized protein n=1 Tax=Rubus argutus TaxID=59490 RepID=A0AAW1XT99_RUBAR